MMPVVRGAGIFVAALLATLALYIGCALVLGAIPRNAGFVETPMVSPSTCGPTACTPTSSCPTRTASSTGVPSFRPRTCVHWPRPLTGLRLAGVTAVSCSTTPTWSDLRPGTAIVALSGAGSGAMHVEYIETPTAYKSRRIRISAAEYERLVAYIRASFVRNTDGRVRQIDAPGYFETDAFYEAVPTYTFWYTCNEWTRRALAAAGIRTAMWAPFDTAVFYHLPDASNAR